MAFCVKCGTKLSDGAGFCANCGSKVEEVKEVKEEILEDNSEAVSEAKQVDNNSAPVMTTADNVEAAKAKLKSVPKFVWLIIVLILAGIIALSVFMNMQSHTLNLNDYLEVEFTGYETIGKCKAEWSMEYWDAFYKKAAKIPSTHDFDLEDKKLQYEISPAEGLSNGDTVTITWKVDKEYFKKHYGLNLKCEEETFKVKGLKKVETFNPFDGIEVLYEGIEGKGSVGYKVVSDDPVYDDLDFRFEDGYKLSNGDTVVCELSMVGAYDEDSTVEECAEKYDLVPTQFKKKYTVKGLGHYVSDVNELTEDNLKPLLKTAEETFEEQTVNWSWEDVATLKSTDFLGSYVLTEKAGDENIVYLVYEVTVDFDELGQHDSCTYYTYVSFTNVTINEDKELGYDTTYHSMPSESYLYESSIEDTYWYQSYSIRGFESLSKLDDYIVKGNLSRYDSDTNVIIK